MNFCMLILQIILVNKRLNMVLFGVYICIIYLCVNSGCVHFVVGFSDHASILVCCCCCFFYSVHVRLLLVMLLYCKLDELKVTISYYRWLKYKFLYQNVTILLHSAWIKHWFCKNFVVDHVMWVHAAWSPYYNFFSICLQFSGVWK